MGTTELTGIFVHGNSINSRKEHLEPRPTRKEVRWKVKVPIKGGKLSLLFQPSKSEPVKAQPLEQRNVNRLPGKHTFPINLTR